MKETQLRNEISTLNIKLTDKKAVSARYSTIRLALLAMMFICVYYGYQSGQQIFTILCIAGLILFLWFVRLHMKLKDDLEQLEAELESCEDILRRRHDEWKTFHDDGHDFLNEDTTQAYDLDIFGNASLYQYLCVAKTPLGRSKFASLLSCERQKRSEIESRQEAVAELVNMKDESRTLTAMLKLFERHGRKKKKRTLENFFDYMESTPSTYPFLIRILMLLLSVFTVASIVASIMLHYSYAIPLALVTLNVALSMLSVIRNSASFQDVSIMENTMMDYEKIFTQLDHISFHSEKMTALKQQMKEAPSAIRRLHHIMMAIRFRNDGIMFIVVNGLFLLDFQCVFALEKWKGQYGHQVRIWMEALGEVEALLSLSQLSYAKDHTVSVHYAECEEPYFAMEKMYHPLINETQAVTNSFDADVTSYIITGSNMSGKTTFLRTIGLNLVLFHAGASVCATSCEANSMNIYTSMRIKDDVSEGISTFYAEILRIRDMIAASDKKEPMLVLIDEIFKGTNSADRIICAQEVLKQLHLPWVISMVSTHDFELCALSFKDGSNAQNYHFSEYYEQDEIHFDYQLKKGKCTTTNAKQLLQMAGISIPA